MAFDFGSIGKIADIANKYAPAINAAVGAVGLYQAYEARKDNKKAMKRQAAQVAKADMQAEKERAFSEKRLNYRSRSRKGAGAFGLYTNFHNRGQNLSTRYK